MFPSLGALLQQRHAEGVDRGDGRALEVGGGLEDAGAFFRGECCGSGVWLSALGPLTPALSHLGGEGDGGESLLEAFAEAEFQLARGFLREGDGDNSVESCAAGTD